MRRNRLLKAVEDSPGRIAEVLELVVACQQEMMKAESESGLVSGVCGLLTAKGVYAHACIVLALPEFKRSEKKYRIDGDGGQCPEALFFSPGDKTSISCPGQMAFSNGRRCVVQNIPADLDFPLWRDRALELGYCSSISLPLFKGMKGKGQAFGTLNICLSAEDGFCDDELRLLEEFAGLLSFVLMEIRDREERKRAAEELAANEKMYHSVFENTGTGTIIIDRDMLILFANERFESLTGYKRSEIDKRMKWSQFVVPEDQERMQRYHYGRRQNKANIPTEYECRIMDKRRNVRYINMQVGMIPGTLNSIASFNDITERKRAEGRLRESEAKLSAIVETFEGIIYVSSRKNRVSFMNKALIKRTGRNAIGELCYKVIHGLDEPCPWCSGDRVFAGERVRREGRSPKDDRWYSSIRSPVFDSDGRITGAQTIMIDITDRKLAEEALAESAKHLRNENLRLRSAIKERYKFGDIVGKSSLMQEVYELILKAAASNAHVMVYGESGTGKELIARAIHQLSSRSKKRFVPVNCGAINENIIESEFFGYKKGAFTGANLDKKGFLDIADEGTLFLDEIGEISLNMQVKLLRAIEGSGYTPVGGNLVCTPNIRIVAATQRNLKELVKKGLMREDFYYRVHIIPIKLPPLRERKDDLPLLIDHFLAMYGEGKDVPPLTGRIIDAFNEYEWPGNIRELQNVLKRYVTLKKIDLMDSLAPGKEIRHDIAPEAPPADGNLSEMVDSYERQVIMNALDQTRWHKTKTADMLGIHRKTLFTKMRKYGLK